MAISANQRIMPPPWVVVLFALFALVWVLHELKEIVFLLVMGYTLAYVLNPWVTRLERYKLSRGVGLILICGCFVIAVLALALGAVPTLLREYAQFAAHFSEYVEVGKGKLNDLLHALMQLAPGAETDAAKPLDFIPAIGADAVPKVLSAVGGALLHGYSITLTIANLLLLPFIVYYLSIDFADLHKKALGFFPVTLRRKVSEVMSEIDGYVSAFVSGQIHVGCILFVIYVIGLGALQIELWFLLAVISGFGSIIPYAGFLVGIVLSSLMALVTFGDLTHLLMVWGVYALVQLLEGTFITPKIVGSKVGLSPLVVILALFAGGKLFGVLGILLAIPGAAVVRVLGRSFYQWMIVRV